MVVRSSFRLGSRRGFGVVDDTVGDTPFVSVVDCAGGSSTLSSSWELIIVDGRDLRDDEVVNQEEAVMGFVESNEVAVLLNLAAAVHNVSHGIREDRHSNHASLRYIHPHWDNICVLSLIICATTSAGHL